MSAMEKNLQDDEQGDGIPTWLKWVIVFGLAYLISKF